MTADEHLRAIVAGEIDDAALVALGVTVDDAPNGIGVSDRSDGYLRPSPSELAAGYVVSWSRGTDALRRWAQIILAVHAIDLAALEDAPDGDALLGAIWDASSGDASGLDLATRISQTQR